jgi:hypothetical protein
MKPQPAPPSTDGLGLPNVEKLLGELAITTDAIKPQLLDEPPTGGWLFGP